MIDAEINTKCLKIIGYFRQRICTNAWAPCRPDRICDKTCIAYRADAICDHAREEMIPPDFFAPGANPMLLLADCVNRKRNVYITIDPLDADCPAVIEIQQDEPEQNVIEECEPNYIAAALARAIVKMEITR